MLLAELYKQSGNCGDTFLVSADNRHKGLALAVEIIKKHREGQTSVQIAMDCNCSVYEVESIVENI